MAVPVYALCALVALVCAGLLLVRARSGRSRMLFWSGLCFVGLFVTNVLAVVDIAVLAGQPLLRWRLVTALAAICLLLYGLIFEDE